jgi:hypothetical protein
MSLPRTVSKSQQNWRNNLTLETRRIDGNLVVVSRSMAIKQFSQSGQPQDMPRREPSSPAVRVFGAGQGKALARLKNRLKSTAVLAFLRSL